MKSGNSNGARTALSARSSCGLAHRADKALSALHLLPRRPGYRTDPNGCNKATNAATARNPSKYASKGSDTMVQLAQAWSEAYQKGNRMSGERQRRRNWDWLCRFAKTTRRRSAMLLVRLNPRACQGQRSHRQGRGGVHCGYDALAVYANRSNPIRKLSSKNCAKSGARWRYPRLGSRSIGDAWQDHAFWPAKQLGYLRLFREHICGKKDGKQREFRQRPISEMNGSAEVVENVSKTPTGLVTAHGL